MGSPWPPLCSGGGLGGFTCLECVRGKLTLPGEFLDVPEPPSKQFLDKFQTQFELSTPVATRHNLPLSLRPPSQVVQDLMNCTHVFVRRDGHIPSLTPLYEGPYEVLSKSEKVFKLWMGARVDSVSITRLKPAYLPPGSCPALPPARGRPRGRPPRQINVVAVHCRKKVSFWFPPSSSS